jgi:biopolymer transport protein ExbD
MHIRDTAGDGEEQPINLTSMMDVVFNLLIFFLVATTAVRRSASWACASRTPRRQRRCPSRRGRS